MMKLHIKTRSHKEELQQIKILTDDKNYLSE